MKKIRIGIVGYGNLGRGVETGLKYAEDMELVGVFTRRDASEIESESKVYNLKEIDNFKDSIDVLILCGGSANDIPEQAPRLAVDFNTVDSFDNHAHIPEYCNEMDSILKENKRTSVVSSGWDPGLFSINRVLSEAILPHGETFTFWGTGVSQGHSDAIRKVSGVSAAVQYTIPSTELINAIANGEKVDYNSHTAHKRKCYIVAEEGANLDTIRETIVNMPDYFVGYETEVEFIDMEEFEKNHKGMPHGGKVIRRGFTDDINMSLYEFSLNLNSNPQFTAAVNIAYARACYKLHSEGIYGAKTVLDVPIRYLSPKSYEELLKMI